MKKIVLALGLIACLFTYGFGQTASQAAKSGEVLAKMRQIDLLTQLIPLALTKDQINKILPEIERARAKMRELEKAEATTLANLDGKISDAIKESIDKGVAPKKELLDELAKTTFTMGLNRQAAGDEFTDKVLKVFEDVCNAGQKKAAANSLKPELLNPNMKSDKMTDEEKIKFFVQNILLDPQAYDILVELAKHAGS